MFTYQLYVLVCFYLSLGICLFVCLFVCSLVCFVYIYTHVLLFCVIYFKCFCYLPHLFVVVYIFVYLLEESYLLWYHGAQTQFKRFVHVLRYRSDNTSWYPWMSTLVFASGDIIIIVGSWSNKNETWGHIGSCLIVLDYCLRV